MAQKSSPFLEVKYGWNYGESGWNIGMDENLIKFSVMFQNTIDDIVNTLPPAVEGKSYYLTTDKRIYYVVGGTYYSTPVPIWYTFKIKTSGANYLFDGSSVSATPSIAQLSNSLKSAAYTDTSSILDAAAISVDNKLANKANIINADFSGIINVPDIDVTANNSRVVNSKSLNDILGSKAAFIVNDVSGLVNANPTRHKFVQTLGYSNRGDGGHGLYYQDLADTSSITDYGTVFVGLNGARWKLVNSGTVKLEQFGAVGNGLHDTAMSRAISWSQKVNSTTEQANAKLTFDSGKTLNLSQSFSIDTPIQLEINSIVNDYGTTGACFIIASSFKSRNTGWKISIPQGARAMNGNTSLPTTVNTSGRGFMEVRRMQFSELEIGNCIAFPNFGLYLNGSENIYTNQHIQQNRIKLGQFGYNGVGLKLLSNSAETGGVQANLIQIQDIFSNFHNMDFDANGFSNSTSNIIQVQAMDAHASGGYGLNCFSSYNRFEFGFVESSLLFQSSSYYNVVKIGNNLSSGVSISDTGNSNWIQTGPPSTAQLPAVVGPTLGNSQRNNSGVAYMVYGSATLTPTTSSDATISIRVGSSATPSEVMKCSITAMTSPTTMVFPFSFLVKPGDYYQLVKSGSGTGTVSNLTLMQSSAS